jgi:hypothetical protein
MLSEVVPRGWVQVARIQVEIAAVDPETDITASSSPRAI